jgi:hypothetical protein
MSTFSWLQPAAKSKIDNTNKDQYDLVVDTNENNLEEVVTLILEKYKEWLDNKKNPAVKRDFLFMF